MPSEATAVTRLLGVPGAGYVRRQSVTQLGLDVL